MFLRASCQLISLAKKDLTTRSTCFVKQKHGVVLKVQLGGGGGGGGDAGLTEKKKPA